jgi:hypothetical protein
MTASARRVSGSVNPENPGARRRRTCTARRWLPPEPPAYGLCFGRVVALHSSRRYNIQALQQVLAVLQ